jgi:hypothetical protein
VEGQKQVVTIVFLSTYQYLTVFLYFLIMVPGTVRKIFSPEEARAARTARIDNIVRHIKSLLAMGEKGSTPDRKAILIKGWALFNPFRARISDEITAIAKLYQTGEARVIHNQSDSTHQVPDDYDLRIARLAIAFHLLELHTSLRKAASKESSPICLALFDSAQDAIRMVLNDGYFSNSMHAILSNYFRVEPAIVAACTAFSIPFTDSPTVLRDAILAHKTGVSERIGTRLTELRDEQAA